jgi:ribose transport system ATP-binding protein
LVLAGLAASTISKRFPGVLAVSNVSLEVRGGEVRALCGENGSGKSTFCGVVAGRYAPDGGAITIDGESIQLGSPILARRAGVGVVFQDLSLVPQLSVAENIWLSSLEHKQVVNRRKMRSFARAALELVEAPLSIEDTVGGLSRSEQTIVEAAKVAVMEPRVAIFDEPTASLSEDDSVRMLALVRRLKERGTAIIYVTHRLREIWEIADSVTVLREGAHVGTAPASEIDEQAVIQMMANRKPENLYPRSDAPTGEVELDAKDLLGSGVAVSLQVRAGEIVGLAGLDGSGKSAVGRLLLGIDRPGGGHVRFGRRQFDARKLRPGTVLNAGVAYYPPDRRGSALFLSRPVRENLTVSALAGETLSVARRLIRGKAERATARTMSERLSIRPAGIERKTMFLSGGNQQKVVVGRALVNEARIHVFDEPTAGVDVGAKVDIYELLREFCEQGCAILLISSDLLEIVHLSHRVYVMHDGGISAHLEAAEISEEAIVRAMFGHAKFPNGKIAQAG